MMKKRGRRPKHNFSSLQVGQERLYPGGAATAESARRYARRWGWRVTCRAECLLGATAVRRLDNARDRA